MIRGSFHILRGHALGRTFQNALSEHFAASKQVSKLTNLVNAVHKVGKQNSIDTFMHHGKTTDAVLGHIVLKRVSPERKNGEIFRKSCPKWYDEWYLTL